MSNIAVLEIYELTAAAFGITVQDISRHYRGRHRRGLPLGLVARMVAVDLCSRHTEATFPEIARAIGWNSRTAGTRFRALIAGLPDLMFGDFTVRIAVEAIEERIDDIHEARCAAAEQAIAKGLAGLARPKQPRSRPGHAVKPRTLNP